MAAKSPDTNQLLDLDRLRFVRGDPRLFARLLPEIRRLRERYYVNIEDFPGRDTQQKLRFAQSLTDEGWLDPTEIANRTPGQRHRNVQVVAALDRKTSKVRGYATSEWNDRSILERWLSRFGPLRSLATIVGERQRALQDPAKHTYIKLSETVRDPGQPPTLDPLLNALALQGQLGDAPYLRMSTMYMHTDQARLKAITSRWGYRHDGNEPQLYQAFGSDESDRASVERHVTNDIPHAISSMLRMAGVIDPPPVEQLQDEL